MGAASSNPVNDLDQQVMQLMKKIESMSDREPQEVLASCGPETRAAVQSEVSAFNQFDAIVQRQKGGPPDTLQQMELIRGLYKSALVRFIIATETGLVLFPIIARHVTSTANIIDTHINQMNKVLATMVRTMGNEASNNMQQEKQIQMELRQQLSQLVQYNNKVTGRMQEIQQTLQQA